MSLFAACFTANIRHVCAFRTHLSNVYISCIGLMSKVCCAALSAAFAVYRQQRQVTSRHASSHDASAQPRTWAAYTSACATEQQRGAAGAPSSAWTDQWMWQSIAQSLPAQHVHARQKSVDQSCEATSQFQAAQADQSQPRRSIFIDHVAKEASHDELASAEALAAQLASPEAHAASIDLCSQPAGNKCNYPSLPHGDAVHDASQPVLSSQLAAQYGRATALVPCALQSVGEPPVLQKWHDPRSQATQHGSPAALLRHSQTDVPAAFGSWQVVPNTQSQSSHGAAHVSQLDSQPSQPAALCSSEQAQQAEAHSLEASPAATAGRCRRACTSAGGGVGAAPGSPVAMTQADMSEPCEGAKPQPAMARCSHTALSSVPCKPARFVVRDCTSSDGSDNHDDPEQRHLAARSASPLVGHQQQECQVSVHAQPQATAFPRQQTSERLAELSTPLPAAIAPAAGKATPQLSLSARACTALRSGPLPLPAKCATAAPRLSLDRAEGPPAQRCKAKVSLDQKHVQAQKAQTSASTKAPTVAPHSRHAQGIILHHPCTEPSSCSRLALELSGASVGCASAADTCTPQVPLPARQHKAAQCAQATAHEAPSLQHPGLSSKPLKQHSGTTLQLAPKQELDGCLDIDDCDVIEEVEARVVSTPLPDQIRSALAAQSAVHDHLCMNTADDCCIAAVAPDPATGVYIHWCASHTHMSHVACMRQCSNLPEQSKHLCSCAVQDQLLVKPFGSKRKRSKRKQAKDAKQMSLHQFGFKQ